MYIMFSVGNSMCLCESCSHGNFTTAQDDCKKCCIEKISSIKNLDKEIKNAWGIFNDYFCRINNDQKIISDMRFSVIFSFIGVPSLFLSSIRSLFLEFFALKEINVEALEKGKWLPQNTNINSKLVESLFITQKIRIPQFEIILEALSFFTDQNYNLHRNKAAHDIISSINSASYITLNDVYNKFICLTYAVICFDEIINKSRGALSNEGIESFPQSSSSQDSL